MTSSSRTLSRAVQVVHVTVNSAMRWPANWIVAELADKFSMDRSLATSLTPAQAPKAPFNSRLPRGPIYDFFLGCAANSGGRGSLRSPAFFRVLMKSFSSLPSFLTK